MTAALRHRAAFEPSTTEPHHGHGLHQAFRDAGIKESPCADISCPDYDGAHDDAMEDAYVGQHKAPVVERDITGLHGFEAYADPDVILHHAMKGGTAGPEPEREHAPLVFRHKGKDHIADGHHRIAGALWAGHKTMPVRFLDLDRKG